MSPPCSLSSHIFPVMFKVFNHFGKSFSVSLTPPTLPPHILPVAFHYTMSHEGKCSKNTADLFTVSVWKRKDALVQLNLRWPPLKDLSVLEDSSGSVDAAGRSSRRKKKHGNKRRKRWLKPAGRQLSGVMQPSSRRSRTEQEEEDTNQRQENSQSGLSSSSCNTATA